MESLKEKILHNFQYKKLNEFYYYGAEPLSINGYNYKANEVTSYKIKLENNEFVVKGPDETYNGRLFEIFAKIIAADLIDACNYIKKYNIKDYSNDVVLFINTVGYGSNYITDLSKKIQSTNKNIEDSYKWDHDCENCIKIVILEKFNNWKFENVFKSNEDYLKRTIEKNIRENEELKKYMNRQYIFEIFSYLDTIWNSNRQSVKAYTLEIHQSIDQQNAFVSEYKHKKYEEDKAEQMYIVLSILFPNKVNRRTREVDASMDDFNEEYLNSLPSGTIEKIISKFQYTYVRYDILKPLMDKNTKIESNKNNYTLKELFPNIYEMLNEYYKKNKQREEDEYIRSKEEADKKAVNNTEEYMKNSDMITDDKLFVNYPYFYKKMQEYINKEFSGSIYEIKYENDTDLIYYINDFIFGYIDYIKNDIEHIINKTIKEEITKSLEEHPRTRKLEIHKGFPLYLNIIRLYKYNPYDDNLKKLYKLLSQANYKNMFPLAHINNCRSEDNVYGDFDLEKNNLRFTIYTNPECNINNSAYSLVLDNINKFKYATVEIEPSMNLSEKIENINLNPEKHLIQDNDIEYRYAAFSGNGSLIAEAHNDFIKEIREDIQSLLEGIEYNINKRETKHVYINGEKKDVYSYSLYFKYNEKGIKNLIEKLENSPEYKADCESAAIMYDSAESLQNSIYPPGHYAGD